MADKYVVLFDQLGSGPRARPRGAVITGQELGSGDELTRQIAIGAVRLATSDEAQHPQVELPRSDR